jgi:phosphoadenosine phosphosulfate reductase
MNELIESIEGKDPVESLSWLAGRYPGQVVFSSSLGMEDQVITDMIFGNDIGIKVFSIDTGRLFNETYELLERTRARYKKSIEVYFPASGAVEKLVTEKGPLSFYNSVADRKECCFIRKVEPLKRALSGQKVWITGIRADQSEARHELRQVEWDESNQVVKYHPLIGWSLDDVKRYLDSRNIPFNPLHNKGFISIGCAPCTRAISPGEDLRAGRWWWEASKKECGLHSS